MPERILVFCRKSVSTLRPAELERELREHDLETLAEVLELPEGEDAAVAKMWSLFRMELASADDIDGVEIHWSDTQRPIQISRGPPLDGELVETLGAIGDGDSAEHACTREHVSNTVEIIAFEMSIHGSHHLAATISEALAFFVAERGDGLVWFYRREFASPDDRGTPLLMTA